MRKHVFVCCIVLMNLASGLYGMNNNPVDDQEVRSEAKEDGARVRTSAQYILLSGGPFEWVEGSCGRFVPMRRKAPRRGISPVTRERFNIPPLKLRRAQPRVPSRGTYLPITELMRSQKIDIISFDHQEPQTPEPMIEKPRNPVTLSPEEQRQEANRKAYEDFKY